MNERAIKSAGGFKSVGRKVGSLTIQMTVPWFVDQTAQVGGKLMDSPACMACWYYYLVAHDAMVTVGTGAPSDSQTLTYKVGSSIAQMPQWMEKRYAAQARSVAAMYGVTVEEMLAMFSLVILEAARLQMPNPAFEYMNPKIQEPN